VYQERFYETVGRTFELCHSPLKDEDDHISKLAVFRDITERKEAEKRLLAANRELDDFVLSIAHDMRSPLCPIIGFAEFLRDNYADKLDEQGLGMVDEIEKQGLKALDLLEDLLKLSQVGRLEPPEKAVDLTRLVREVQKELRAPITQGNVTVQLAPLPPLSLPATLLFQLFTNLISNAISYAGSAGSPIEVGGQRNKERVRYFVRDHGPGIPEEERERIFDLFYRGSSPGTGTGIGLATVRKIVRLYNGRIWVEETPGGGSTFWVEFPLSKNN
jgi:signal transduction histidine kinase